jgi:F-type H+-transporting ATPase subunit a
MAEPSNLPPSEQFINLLYDHVSDSSELHFFNAHYTLPKFGDCQITRYMVLELVAAALCVLILVPLARRARKQRVIRGPFANFFEAIFVFLREQVARPAIGHDADHYVPYLATAFFFILFCNLLGMIPFGGSPTANIMVTGTLALATFACVHGSGVKQMGIVAYIHSITPPVPKAVYPLVFFAELIGHVTKTLALAIRLFANIFAGHMVLTVMLGLIVLFLLLTNSVLVSVATAVPAVPLVIALNLLELFVAFLQAYVFTFLSALFIGMAVHPHH